MCFVNTVRQHRIDYCYIRNSRRESKLLHTSDIAIGFSCSVYWTLILYLLRNVYHSVGSGDRSFSTNVGGAFPPVCFFPHILPLLGGRNAVVFHCKWYDATNEYVDWCLSVLGYIV